MTSFDALGGDFRDARVGRPGQRAQQQQVELVEIELPRHRRREVAVGHLGKQQVAVGAAVAQERELVLAAALVAEARLDFARIGEPHPALPQQVEADVGERDVLLDDGTVADPLAQPLRQHDVGVAQPLQVLEQRLVRFHMCFTSSGIGKNVGWR